MSRLRTRDGVRGGFPMITGDRAQLGLVSCVLRAVDPCHAGKRDDNCSPHTSMPRRVNLNSAERQLRQLTHLASWECQISHASTDVHGMSLAAFAGIARAYKPCCVERLRTTCICADTVCSRGSLVLTRARRQVRSRSQTSSLPVLLRWPTSYRSLARTAARRYSSSSQPGARRAMHVLLTIESLRHNSKHAYAGHCSVSSSPGRHF